MASILLMEDDVDQAALLADVLETAGHRVKVTYSGKDALAAFDRDDVDIVVADLVVAQDADLAPQDGVSLIDNIRTAERQLGHTGFARMPIIALSGKFAPTGWNADGRLADAVGADAYFAKPAPIPSLLAKIDDFLSRFDTSGSKLNGPLPT